MQNHNKLKQRRISLGLTQSEIAQHTKIPVHQIHAYESRLGNSQISIPNNLKSFKISSKKYIG